jgi:pyridoxamine 5'-phosphate oxidase
LNAAADAIEPPGDDPIVAFHRLFAAARQQEAADPTAAALATADADGRPTARIVLVKHVDEAGFRFFTNRGSRKARELAENPRAALCFWWPTIGWQLRAEGGVEPLSDADSDAYFAGRARDSQIGAWASRQSAPLASRQLLEERCAQVAERYAGGPVPRPPFWGGYLLVPERIEAWSGRQHRLHDRWLYCRLAAGWSVERLYP